MLARRSICEVGATADFLLPVHCLLTLRQQIICGIDIGNSAVKTVIAELNQQTWQPQIIGIGQAPSNGLRRGVVVDMEETVENIRESVAQAEAMAGTKVNRAHISINGLHIHTQPSHGVIVVSRADNEISQYDIDRVIDAAATISLPANREIIHVIPRNFIIDAQEHVKNALGMKGVRLEAEVLLIDGLSPYIRNLAKCVNANDIEVAEFVFAPLATAKAILDKHQREHGVLNIDFGGGISSMILFREGELIHTAVLPVGSRHITNDLAVAFRTSMDRAEQIKHQYGYAGPDPERKENIDLSQLLEEEDFIVPRKQIAKVIDARVSELFDIIADELKKVSRGNHLPAGIVLAGGGSNLAGLPVFTKDRLRLAVRSVQSELFEGIVGKELQPAFATALGLVVWGFEKEVLDRNTGVSNLLSQSLVKKLSKWLKNFLP